MCVIVKRALRVSVAGLRRHKKHRVCRGKKALLGGDLGAPPQKNAEKKRRVCRGKKALLRGSLGAPPLRSLILLPLRQLYYYI